MTLTRVTDTPARFHGQSGALLQRGCGRRDRRDNQRRWRFSGSSRPDPFLTLSLSLSTPAWGVGKTGFPRRTRSFYCVIIIAGPDEVASPRALDRRMGVRARVCLMTKSRVYAEKTCSEVRQLPAVRGSVQCQAVCKQSRFRIIFRCRRPQTLLAGAANVGPTPS